MEHNPEMMEGNREICPNCLGHGESKILAKDFFRDVSKIATYTTPCPSCHGRGLTLPHLRPFRVRK